MLIDDTIAAIATPLGAGGIGVIRLSGPGALAIADKIFLSKDGKKPSEYKTYTVHYGWIVNGLGSRVSGLRSRLAAKPWSGQTGVLNDRRPETGGWRPVIDEVLLTVMRAPKSYTKQDIVEISCHSGIVVLREILDLVLARGARLSEPGEFTKRAFLNGRIDLSQAEAVVDIIQAQTTLALESGVRQLKGQLADELKRIKKELLKAIALLEANIDFPEEEIETAQNKKIERAINSSSNRISALLRSVSHGRVLREGIRAVILGRANTGKSSLLNALLKEERAIVSPVAGTTRDAIEEIIDIQGIPLKIADTAGIIEPKDLIEKEALKRTRKYLEKADLVLLVLDAAKRLTPEDRLLFKKVSGRPAGQAGKQVIAVLNKSDLKSKIEEEEIAGHFSHFIRLSTKKGWGLRELEEKIVQLCWQGRLEPSQEIILTNSRHIQLLSQAQETLDRAWNSLEEGLSLEYVAEDLRLARNFICRVTGETADKDILDEIFSRFCIGK